MNQPRVITALITPFFNGKLDVEGLKANIAYQLENGIEGILVLGTTGEAPTLTKDERKIVIETAVKSVSGRALVFVGTGTNGTESTIEQTNEAQALGADVALVVTPYYNCPMQEGIYDHFSAISHTTKIPICLYHIPKRTGCYVTVDTLIKIATLPRIIGIKEASGDLNQAARLLKELNIMVWGGDDTLTLPIMSLGGRGIISVASNLIPHKIKALVDAAAHQDFETARHLFFDILPLLNALFIETNPIPIKAAMEMSGMAAGPCRLPLGAMHEENRKKLSGIIYG